MMRRPKLRIVNSAMASTAMTTRATPKTTWMAGGRPSRNDQ